MSIKLMKSDSYTFGEVGEHITDKMVLYMCEYLGEYQHQLTEKCLRWNIYSSGSLYRHRGSCPLVAYVEPHLVKYKYIESYTPNY